MNVVHAGTVVRVFVGAGVAAVWIASHAATRTLEELVRVYPLPVEEIRASYDVTALPDLIRMLDDRETLRYRDNVVLAVGVVGGEKGVDVLVEYLERHFDRELEDDEWRALDFVPLALGTAAAQGSTNAGNYLISRHTLVSWRQNPVKWWRKNAKGEQIYQSLVRKVLLGLTYVDDAQVDIIFAKVTGDDAPEYQEIRRLVPDSVRFGEARDAMRKARKQALKGGADIKPNNEPGGGTSDVVSRERPITEAEAIAGRRAEGTRLPDDEAVQLKALALEQYDSIAKVLLGDKPEDSLASLALQGKPVIGPDRIGKEDLASVVNRVGGSESLEKTKAITREVKALTRAGSQYGSPSAIRRTDGSLSVIIPVQGTEAIREAHLPAGCPTETIVKGRILAVYMVKVGDRWYWNPFGW